MKKSILFTACLLLTAYCFSQTCNMALKNGAKTSATITTYTNPLNTDKKFLKAKDAERDVLIAAYNADVMSGKIAPATNYEMSFNITKKTIKDADEYAIAYNVGGVDYFSYVTCRNDTIYSVRNKGIVSVGTKEAPIGYSIMGTQIIPMNLKVGDVLPPFEDIGFLFPTGANVTLYKQVLAGYETVHSTRWGPGVDSQTGISCDQCQWDVSTPREVYKSVPVEARQTSSVSSYSIQGMNSLVTGEEEVTVSGVKYKAYIVESESWFKSNVKTSYESADEELNQAQAEADQKLFLKMEKRLIKKQFTNKLGFLVQSSKQWMVPQLGGAVKTISYDTNGGISTIITTTKLE